MAREKKREFKDWDYWGKPVPGFGDPRARLLIVGLAPAAHGGNRTGRVFTGDSSGDWLYEALHRFGFASQAGSTGRDDGLVLTDCYVTASARCAPPGNKPTTKELENCRPYLEAELRLLDRVKVVVALGRIGFETYFKANGGKRERGKGKSTTPTFRHLGETEMPGGRILLASYHPSRQNTNTRRLTREMWYAVFERARQVLERPEV
ncbi:MAG: uracil-DNA glycosylase [Gemmatimonadetes bacterium]|nr:uracil-DNA glycosylase [Gemmatimonadota bacterium]